MGDYDAIEPENRTLRVQCSPLKGKHQEVLHSLR